MTQHERWFTGYNTVEWEDIGNGRGHLLINARDSEGEVWKMRIALGRRDEDQLLLDLMLRRAFRVTMAQNRSGRPLQPPFAT